MRKRYTSTDIRLCLDPRQGSPRSAGQSINVDVTVFVRLWKGGKKTSMASHWARNIDSFFLCLKMWLSMAVTINGLILMGHFGGNHGELTSKYKCMH